MSQLAGTKCRLTLSPSTSTVVWATEQEDGLWAVSELDPYTVIVRLPQASAVEGARKEYQHLVRATLPIDPKEAAARIRTHQYRQRIDALQAVHRDLWEQHPDVVPYVPDVWHPVDEI